MSTIMSQLVRHALATIMFVLILGSLSMIWPSIIAIFLGVFLLLQSCSAEKEPGGLSWTEIGHVSIVFAS